MNLRVGDRVKIKENLSECEFGHNHLMDEYIGKEAIIVRIWKEGMILLDIDKQNWNWDENVLEKIEQEMEVNKSDLKAVDVSVETTDKQIDSREALQKALDEVKEQLLETKSKVINMKDESFNTEDYIVDLDDVKEPVENDPVNHPTHYTDTKIEVIDYIEDKGLNFNRGNVIKYVSRAGKKDPNKEVEDLEKARFYLNREIERLKKLQSEDNE